MRRSLRIIILSLLAIGLLAGCTHAIKVPLFSFDNTPPPSRDRALQRLKDATPCCHVWADLPYHDQLPSEPREFTIDKFSPVGGTLQLHLDDGRRLQSRRLAATSGADPDQGQHECSPHAEALGKGGQESI